MKNKDPLKVAHNLKKYRYPDAAVAFAAGSVFRGEGTSFSDIDLVVLYDHPFDNVRRETFEAEGWPVEAFIHTVQSQNYFFNEDRKGGVPVMMNMVYEGTEIPGPCPLSVQQKSEAKRLLELGPPALNEGEIQNRRYTITNLLDDLCGVTKLDERYAILCELYAGLADFYLRINGQWSGSGKGLPRALHRYDPGMAKAYVTAFGRIFQHQGYEELLTLADDILRPHGGRLLYYEQNAGPQWKSFKGPEI